MLKETVVLTVVCLLLAAGTLWGAYGVEDVRWGLTGAWFGLATFGETLLCVACGLASVAFFVFAGLAMMEMRMRRLRRPVNGH